MDKATELNDADQKLSELIVELTEVERLYDKAVEHSANYLGSDERIEQIRDEKAKALLKSVLSVKKQIEHQAQLIQKLTANY